VRRSPRLANQQDRGTFAKAVKARAYARKSGSEILLTLRYGIVTVPINEAFLALLVSCEGGRSASIDACRCVDKSSKFDTGQQQTVVAHIS
jgi:hypothetical protein